MGEEGLEPPEAGDRAERRRAREQSVVGTGRGPGAPEGERPAEGDGGTLLWVQPALAAPSGGLRYNQHIREALDRRGVRSQMLSLRGSWPRPSREESASAVEQLRRAAAARGVRAVIVDGLIGGCVPELLETGSQRDGPGHRRGAGGAVPPGKDDAPGSACGRRPVAEENSVPTVLLVHLSLSGMAEAERAAGSDGQPTDNAPCGAPEEVCERRAVEAADAVLTTSRWSAEDLLRRYGREDVVVAVPGAQAVGTAGAEPSGGGQMGPERGALSDDRGGPGRPLRLTCVATLNPLKNQRFLADVLEPLLDLDWTLSLAGAAADTQHGHDVLTELHRRLLGRVEHRGVLGPEQMAEHWGAADLLLLPSRVETYGMVVTEACAHGVPAFVSAGTGAQEALGGAAAASGWALPVSEPEAWTRAVHRFLTEPQSRTALAEGVRRRRPLLPTWEQAAEKLLAVLPE